MLPGSKIGKVIQGYRQHVNAFTVSNVFNEKTDHMVIETVSALLHHK